MNNENMDLKENKNRLEKELCEMKTQNSFLKEKVMTTNKGEMSLNEDKMVLCNQLKELTKKVCTF